MHVGTYVYEHAQTLPVNEGHVCAGVHMCLHATSEVMECRVCPQWKDSPVLPGQCLSQVPLPHPFTESLLSLYSLPTCP